MKNLLIILLLLYTAFLTDVVYFPEKPKEPYATYCQFYWGHAPINFCVTGFVYVPKSICIPPFFDNMPVLGSQNPMNDNMPSFTQQNRAGKLPMINPKPKGDMK